MDSLDINDLNFIERFLHAFKSLGGNEFGFIDYKLFQQALCQRNVTEIKDVTGVIDSEQHVSDGKLDFVSLCFSILSTKAIFNRSFENGKVVPPSPQINTRTFTRSKGSTNIPSNNHGKIVTKEKLFAKSIRGLLFNINEDQLSYRYQLEVLESSVVEIFAKAISNTGETTPKIPIEILVFQDGQKKTFITSSSVINEEGYCSVKFTLKKGKYILIPVLLKWSVLGKSNSFDSLNLESLVHIEEDSGISLTPACENALRVVFDSIDLNENGLLSQGEFDLFIQHTSGESATEEWTTIEDNFKMENQQLTFDGFLELYRMVLQTDPSDVMNMLQHMGMNESLELENAQPFNLIVKSESKKFNLKPLPVSSYKEVTQKLMRKLAVEQGSSSKVMNLNDLFLYTHRLPHRVTVVVQNQSHSKVTVNLDCTKSTNCDSHLGGLDGSVDIAPRTSMIGHHLFPVNLSQDWNVECIESLK